MNDASSRQRGTTWPRRHRHLVAVCAALLTAALCLLPVGASRAVAAGVSQSVRISLSGDVPAVSASGQSVVVSGSLTNTGSQTVAAPVIHLSINSERLLDTRSSAGDWQSGKLDLPLRQVASATTAPIAPGSTMPFAVTIPGKQLKFSYGLASLPLAITVTDGQSASASAVRGTTRTALHQQNTTVRSPLQVSVVIPLTLPADTDLFGPTGAVRAAAWERAIGPDSRVQRLLDAFSGMPVIFAVDPALLDPPAAADDNVPSVPPSPTSSAASSSAATSGSPTGTPSGSDTQQSTTPDPTSTDAPVSGTSAATAPETGGSTDQPTQGPTDDGSTPVSQSPTSSSPEPTSPDGRIATAVDGLADRLATLSEPASLWWLPADDPDLVALHAAGQDGTALLQRDLSRALPDTARDLSTTRVIWPTGNASRAAITAAAGKLAGDDGDPAIAVVPDRALPAANDLTATSVHRVAGTSGVLSYDEGLSRIFSSSSTSPGTQTSRLLTQLLAIYQQSPGTPRSLAVVAPRTGGADPAALATRVSALQTASWLQLRPGAQTVAALSAAARATLLATPRKGAPYPAVPGKAVTAAELRDLDRSRRQLTALQSVLVGGDQVLPQRIRALDIIGSTRWRGAAAQLAAVADRDDAAVSAMLSKLSIRASTINFFADSGDISVTIANDLNRPVHNVLLHLQRRNYLIQVTDAEKTVDIEAGGHAAARFHIKAVGGGTVVVEAVLRAPDGAPLGAPGAPSQLKINVHPTSGWIMWVLGALAVLVLVIGLGRAILRGPRTASEATPEGEPTPDETIVDAGPGSRQADDDEGTGDR